MMEEQIITIEQYERHLHYKRKADQAERVVNLLWALIQGNWRRYTAQEREGLKNSLEKEETKMIHYKKKAKTSLTHRNAYNINIST